MRLIDADTLLYENIECADGHTYMIVHAPAIDNAPTAFDLESVIEQIGNIKTDNSCNDCQYRYRCDKLQDSYNPADDVDLRAFTTKHLALEILKSAANGNFNERVKTITLPCEIHDAVFWVNDWFYDGKIGLNHEWHITESKVSMFFYNELGLFAKLKNGENISVSDFRKTVFLTREQAEDELSKLQK